MRGAGAKGPKGAALRGSLDARRLRRLVESGLLLGRELSLEALLERVVESAAALLGVHYVALGVLEPGGKGLSRFITHGLTEAQKEAIGPAPTGKGLLGALLSEGRPLRLDHLASDPRSVGFPEGHPPMDRFLGVPIIWRGEVYGRLYCCEKWDGSTFDQEDEEVALLLAAQAASALENARLFAEAEEASRLKSEFLANMSHELRTPLSAILGFNELLLGRQMGPLGAEQEEALGRVSRNAEQLLELINDLLSLSRLEAGRMEVAHAPYLPRAVAEGVVSSLEPLAAKKHLTLALAPDPQPGLCWGDEAKVRQILTNLVGNAIKFTPEGGSVVLNFEGVEGQWALCVADDGPGIDPAHHDWVFDAFRQVDGTSKRAQGGTGLGLAISRKLAVLLGGSLALESSLGLGSRFTLSLPRGAAPHSPAPPEAQVWGPKLLVVQEDEGLAPWYRQALGPGVGVIRQVQEGAAVLGEALHWGPDALVLDPGLAGLVDAWELLRRFKANPQLAQVPVLLAHAKPLGSAILTGPVELVTRPHTEADLRQAVDRAMTTPRPGPLWIWMADPLEEGPKMRESFRESGREVRLISSLEEALPQPDQAPPALVLLDLSLPHRQAFDLLAAWGAQPAWRRVPVVFSLPIALGPALAEELAMGSQWWCNEGHLEPCGYALAMQELLGRVWAS